MCYIQHIEKGLALEYARRAFQYVETMHHACALASIYLWDNQIDQSMLLVRNFLYDASFIQTNGKDIIDYLLLLAAKSQLAFLSDYFNTPAREFSEQFKPIYYAVLKLLGSEDFKRMPLELQDPVDDILKQIERLRIMYE
jgi:hypothetical protein